MMIKAEEIELFAEFLQKNYEKEEIISKVFDFFELDCLERCRYNPSITDNLINNFIASSDETQKRALCEVISYFKDGCDKAIKQENDLLKLVMCYIENHIGEFLNVEEIAQAMHISYFYLCHMFKEKSGTSLTDFITQKRLEKALKMLLKTDDKITEIAHQCGFNNASYFTEIFSKYVGMTPSVFKKNYSDIVLHDFYDLHDILFTLQLKQKKFLAPNIAEIPYTNDMVSIHEPNETFSFLHETAIIEYHGVLFASWYNCPDRELSGFTPIIGKRSYDNGKTWIKEEIICSDKYGNILYCPPVYGICEDKLYMFVNQMVAPDRIHALDLYVLNEKTDHFELLWSRPIPFKLNTNVVTLPNGKLLLPGRIGELDGFPNTPAILISDSGKIDSEWRLVKIAQNGNLPLGAELIHPEISIICAENILYMFCRNDMKHTPLVYISEDFGETWSDLYSHDIPYVSTKIYCGDLKDGRHYIICNTDKTNRTKLTVYFTEDAKAIFTEKIILFDTEEDVWGAMHYPAACEFDGFLYIIATKGYQNTSLRGAVLFKIKISD